jgi:hypothetical protein
MSRNRMGAASLATAGVLFVLYPAIRPWHDESTVSGATASMSSPAWVAAHFFAVLGFILVPLGLLAVGDALARTRSASLALTAAVVTWIGAGLTLPYYGAEDFGLHAIASKHAGNLLELVKAVRYQPLAITIFGAGLLMLGIGALLAAVAIWRSGILPRYSGIVFAVGLALFLPQFYLPPAARIAHGVLTGIGLAMLAVSLWRVKATTVEDIPAARGPAPDPDLVQGLPGSDIKRVSG